MLHGFLFDMNMPVYCRTINRENIILSACLLVASYCVREGFTPLEFAGRIWPLLCQNPLLQINSPQHQEDTSIPHLRGAAGSGPGICHLAPRLLQLAPG